MAGQNQLGLVLLVWLNLVLGTGCMYTKWLPNTNLNNPYNWNSGRLPCGNDRMIIPDDSPVVYMQMNTTIQELVLPASGELVFGMYATLAFTNKPDHSATCLDSGTDSIFNASHPAQWLDPSNWCPTNTEQGPCKTVPLLDTEKIPCATDHVIFPTGSSYYVDLGSSLDLEVNTLKISGKAYSTLSFKTYVVSDNGRNIFPLPSSGRQSTINIRRQRCRDPTGCGCGNDKGKILEEVCKIHGPYCVRRRCLTQIHPVGHCCNMCGSMLVVTYGTGFNFDTLKSGVQRNFLDGKEQFSSVQLIVSKRSDGKVQLVLTDQIDGSLSKTVAQQILSDINADIRGGGFRYGVTQVSFISSAGGGYSAHTGSSGRSSGTVAGISIGVILAIVLVLAISFLIYRKKMSPEEDLGFNINMFNKFNRFNLGVNRNPQVSMPPSVGWHWSGSLDSGVSSTATSQGFDNPIYGSTPLENMVVMELEMTSDMNVPVTQPIDDRSFENPLYDTTPHVRTKIIPSEEDQGYENPLYGDDNQESQFSDPTEVEDPQLGTVMTIGGPGEKDSQA